MCRKFQLEEVHLPFGTVLGVVGPSSGLSPHVSISNTAQSSSTLLSCSFNTTPQSPAFKSVIPESKEQRVTVNITQASMETLPNGKSDFISQAMDIAEPNANVVHIMNEVQLRWGVDMC